MTFVGNNYNQSTSYKGFWGVWLLTVAIIMAVIHIIAGVRSEYTYEKNYLYAWNLSDKSSTIVDKQKYISEFYDNLMKDGEKFAPYNSLCLRTKDNQLAFNLKALESLRDRLNDIQKMNPSSFEYNTAIQQITAQEQGEASNMLHVFQGCYDLAFYPIAWDWIGLLFGIFYCVIGCCGIILLCCD